MGTRPYLRSSLARSMYTRMLNDRLLQNLDKTKWYSCELDTAPDEVQNLFLESATDDQTENFLQVSFEKSDWLFTQMFHALAKVFLCWFMSKTSVNGILGRGSMFVFSSNQFEALLEGCSTSTKTGRTLLDIGAGDGNVTDVMASYFDKVYVTEVSGVMRKILNSKGYNLLEVENWWQSSQEPIHFDVITCLNVLDRCDRPLTMLRQMRNKLYGSDVLILALVLPLHQFVEDSGHNSHQPSERIFVKGSCFTEQVTSLVTDFFPLNGFHVIRWTRLPYLCEGDLGQSFYWLDDAIFVLRRTTQNTECGNSADNHI